MLQKNTNCNYDFFLVSRHNMYYHYYKNLWVALIILTFFLIQKFQEKNPLKKQKK